MRRTAAVLLMVGLGAAGLGRPAMAAPVGNQVWCDAFGGKYACGSLVTTKLDERGPDNGSLPGAILNGKYADAEGLYDGNDIGAKGLSEKERATLFGPDAVLLASSEGDGKYGELDLDRAWKATGASNAEAGKFVFTSTEGSSFVPRWLSVKAGDGFTVWDISSVVSSIGKEGAMIFAGYFSTEGNLAGGKNYASLGHATIWGTTAAVPLPTSALMLLSGLVGLVGLRRAGRGIGEPRE